MKVAAKFIDTEGWEVAGSEEQPQWLIECLHSGRIVQEGESTYSVYCDNSDRPHVAHKGDYITHAFNDSLHVFNKHAFSKKYEPAAPVKDGDVVKELKMMNRNLLALKETLNGLRNDIQNVGSGYSSKNSRGDGRGRY